tara:strand:- start:151 stop:336 length:186 start_codon:yes stop_codon:yes gene_type:complete
MREPSYVERIKRFDDVALVTITEIFRDEDGNLKCKTVSEYETLSRGATDSARKEIKRLLEN